MTVISLRSENVYVQELIKYGRFARCSMQVKVQLFK